MAERTRDDDVRVVDLADSEGEPTWRADVLFDRVAERPQRIFRLIPLGMSLLAIVIVGLIVQRVRRQS